MFSMKKNKLVSINNYIQGMHMIFSDLNLKRDTRNNTTKFQKKFELGFEIGLPANETQFAKTTVNNSFFNIMETSTDRTGTFYKIII